MKLKDKKGSISIFVLVTLLFISSFLIILYANNVNKSKVVKEQFEIINGIYSKNNGDEGSYTNAYTDIRERNRQRIVTTFSNDTQTNMSTLVLRKTFYENFNNIKIYGNTESESGVGDLTTNIFDGQVEVGEYGTGSGITKVDTIDRMRTVNYIPVKPNTYYVCNLPNFRVFSFKDNTNSTDSYLGYNDSGHYENIFKTSADCNYIKIVWFNIPEDTTQKIWINEGKILYEYQEYNDISTKYKISLRVTYISSNIFDGKLVESDKIATGGSGGTNRIESENFIPVKPNTTYISNRGNFRTYCYNSAKEQIKRIESGGINVKTVTTPESCEYIRCVWFGTPDTTQTIWINEGTELLDYEPYLSYEEYSHYEAYTIDIYMKEQLKEGEYIDLSNKRLTRIDGQDEEVIVKVNGKEVNIDQLKLFEDYTKIEVLTTVEPSRVDIDYIGYTLD